MPNHCHLIASVPAGTLAAGMQHLNGGYARQFNKRHGRRDHVFGRRYWSKRAEDDSYVKWALRYVALNPVRAGLVERPEDYRWSSHAATLGLVEAPSFLAVDAVLELFSPDPAMARAAYRRFVLAERPVSDTVTEV
jgi:putative transposase